MKKVLDILWAITGGIPGIGSAIAFIVKTIKDSPFSTMEIVLLIILFLFSAFFIIYQIWRRKSIINVYYPYSFLRMSSYEYVVEKKTITYTRESNDVLKYGRELSIKSANRQLREIRDKYIWTGEGDNFEIKGTKNCKVQLEQRIGIWQYFKIVPDNKLEKGHNETYEYQWPDIPKCKKSHPFISTSTEEPTKEIVIKLRLGEEYSGQTIYCEEYRSSDSDICIFSHEETMDSQGAFTWIIKAKRFRLYQIRWSWEKGRKPTELL